MAMTTKALTPDTAPIHSPVLPVANTHPEPVHGNTAPVHGNTWPVHGNTKPIHANTWPAHANTVIFGKDSEGNTLSYESSNGVISNWYVETHEHVQTNVPPGFNELDVIDTSHSNDPWQQVKDSKTENQPLVQQPDVHGPDGFVESKGAELDG